MNTENFLQYYYDLRRSGRLHWLHFRRFHPPLPAISLNWFRKSHWVNCAVVSTASHECIGVLGKSLSDTVQESQVYTIFSVSFSMPRHQIMLQVKLISRFLSKMLQSSICSSLFLNFVEITTLFPNIKQSLCNVYSSFLCSNGCYFSSVFFIR